MACALTLISRDHDDEGTEFVAKISNIQGIYDVEFSGKFRHHENDPRSSTWEPNNWAKINTQQHAMQDVYSVLGGGNPNFMCPGDGDIDVGELALDTLISGELDDDFEAWTEDLAIQQHEARREREQNDLFHQRQAGF